MKWNAAVLAVTMLALVFAPALMIQHADASRASAQNVILYSPRDITYSIYYPNETAAKDMTISGSVIIKNPINDTMTTFSAFGGDIVQGDVPEQANSWYAYIEIYDLDGNMIKSYGPLNYSYWQDPIKLDPTKKYEMRCIIHVPPGLTLDHDYAQSFQFLALRNGTRQASGAGTMVANQVFTFHIKPTLSYLIRAHVYDPDGSPVENATVTITNENTGETVKNLKTDDKGYVEYDLHSMGDGGIGYSNGDTIVVKAEKGKLSGENTTTVSLGTEDYIEGTYGSNVNIYLKAPPEEGPNMALILGVSLVGIVIIVIGAYMIAQKKKREAQEENKASEKGDKRKE